MKLRQLLKESHFMYNFRFINGGIDDVFINSTSKKGTFLRIGVFPSFQNEHLISQKFLEDNEIAEIRSLLKREIQKHAQIFDNAIKNVIERIVSKHK